MQQSNYVDRLPPWNPLGQAFGARTMILGLLLGTAGCAAEIGESDAEPAAPVDTQTASPPKTDPGGARPVGGSLRADLSLKGEMGTVLGARALAGERLASLGIPELAARRARLERLTSEISAELAEVEHAGDSASPTPGALSRLSRLSGQLPVEVKRLKQALARSGVTREAHADVYRGLDALKLAAQSLGAGVLEAQRAAGSPLSTSLSAAEEGEVSTLSGPIFPGSSWYYIDAGHVDAVDVAYEDEELELTIHDESVSPDVERDPKKTILVVKGAAKFEIPDERFAFLGPVGSTAWVLPESQIDAENLGILWPGVSTQELEAGVFRDDVVDIRFDALLGPNGLSLFESPQDELTPPVVLVDSEDGFPDTLTTPVGIHRHMNWAFESAGVYLLSVQTRGRLAEVPGNPVVHSAHALLKFVVLP